MRDSFHREINYMRISITDRCNLRCVYCMPHGIPTIPMAEILTFEEIARVCRQAVCLGITRFKITGGEPLARLGCPDLIRMIRQIPDVQQVTMTTNGVLLGKYLRELAEAGLDAVNISLDTTDRNLYAKITGSDCLSQVISSLEAARQYGLKVKINSVLQQNLNADAWRDLLALAKRYGIDIRFIELMPVGQGKCGAPISNTDLYRQIENEFGQLTPDKKRHGNGPAVYYRLPGFDGSVGFISPIHGKFCNTCNRIRMTSTGEIKPCLGYESTFDVRAALRGNIVLSQCQKDVILQSEQNPDITLQNQDDETVRRILAEAISAKPKMHCFETLTKNAAGHLQEHLPEHLPEQDFVGRPLAAETRDMSKIGG
ncbi:MAG: GTP 3',8-cyclase MoaA [Clostridiales bacterium]|nr:GTP 3',8-cyclase MoaA [Clostridiales bacterium]